MKLQIFLKTLIISGLILIHASFAEETIEINAVEEDFVCSQQRQILDDEPDPDFSEMQALGKPDEPEEGLSEEDLLKVLRGEMDLPERS